MLVWVNNQNNLEYIKGAMSHSRERDNYLECSSLEPGIYYYYVEIDWDENTENYNPMFEFCVNVYGVGHVDFLLDDTKTFDKSELLKQIFISKAHTKSNQLTVNHIAEDKSMLRCS